MDVIIPQGQKSLPNLPLMRQRGFSEYARVGGCSFSISAIFISKGQSSRHCQMTSSQNSGLPGCSHALFCRSRSGGGGPSLPFVSGMGGMDHGNLGWEREAGGCLPGVRGAGARQSAVQRRHCRCGAEGGAVAPGRRLSIHCQLPCPPGREGNTQALSSLSHCGCC